jgi:hypothetical protein
MAAGHGQGHGQDSEGGDVAARSHRFFLIAEEGSGFFWRPLCEFGSELLEMDSPPPARRCACGLLRPF